MAQQRRPAQLTPGHAGLGGSLGPGASVFGPAGLAALALENIRLQAALAAQLDEVRTSRARIVQAALAERRKVERDLHDGAQQRLLALSLTVARPRAHSRLPNRTSLNSQHYRRSAAPERGSQR
jgi:signal transduction histidine kinase